jgi:phosphomannomutase
MLLLFDVDGTLTPSRLPASKEILDLIKSAKRHCAIAYVGGSDLAKQKEQLGDAAVDGLFDFGFSENGATAFRLGRLIAQDSFIGYLGEAKYKELVNFILSYLAQIDIPVKRGTFVEFRNGMVNVSPIGRSCSQAEREQFAKLDAERGIRKAMVEALRARFSEFGLSFSIGGQISIDIFPSGWDKTLCLKHVIGEGFTDIHFFGDRTEVGGNDHEIFNHPAVHGHTVRNPADTVEQVKALLQW